MTRGIYRLYRRDASGEWSLVNSSKASGKSLELFGSSRDGRIYATKNDGKSTTAFGVVDPDTGAFKPLFRDPVSDPSGYIASVDGSEVVLGIATEAGAPEATMIVNVHGGPMGPRDDWRFNWESQLFASRGYAVLQINYRGSGGFGKGFQDMGYGQWATGIMNDIVDATKWTINQGYADKDRICIYGGSFGGYASMMAPAREQGLFKCAFGYVGAYDAEVQMTKSDTSQAESGRMYLLRALGKTKTERDAMSPVNYAADIKIPVYLAASARDPRCPPENTEAMNKALIAAGNAPEGMMITPGEMHGYCKDENKLKLYTEMLNFFARHIGGKPAGGGAPSAAASAP